MTDTTRDLIQRLADALTNAIRVIHNEDGTQHISTAAPVLTEARVYLDQPEPEEPTDEELMALAVTVYGNPFSTDEHYAHAVLVRRGRPAVEPHVKPAHNTAQDSGQRP